MNKQTYLRTTLAAVAVVASLACAQFAAAQSAKTAMVVIVDSGEIIRSSLAGKDLTRQAENQNAELQAERARLEQQFQNEQQELGRQRDLLSQEAFEEKLQALSQRLAAAENDFKDKARRYQIGVGKAEAALQSKLTPIFQSLMQKHGANLILERRFIVMPGGGMDITREVIDRLDQDLPSFKLEIPPAGTQ